jgi:hypothetical protein
MLIGRIRFLTRIASAQGGGDAAAVAQPVVREELATL